MNYLGRKVRHRQTGEVATVVGWDPTGNWAKCNNARGVLWLHKDLLGSRWRVVEEEEKSGRKK